MSTTRFARLNSTTITVSGFPSVQKNRKAFKRQRIHDQFASGLRRVHNQPCWTGEPSPSHNLNGAPLEIFYLEDLYAANTVEEHTKRFLLSIGVRLLARSAKETRLMSATARLHNLKVFLRSMVATKTKELTENLTVELLRRSQLSEAKINAVYEVIFEDARVDVVARERNLRLNALQQTLGRIRREVEPEVQKQLEAWLTQEPEVAGVHEELEAVKDDLHKERTGEMGTPQDGRQPLVRPF